MNAAILLLLLRGVDSALVGIVCHGVAALDHILYLHQGRYVLCIYQSGQTTTAQVSVAWMNRILILLSFLLLIIIIVIIFKDKTGFSGLMRKK